MKKWTVTYRDASGARTETEISAEDRAGVIAAMKARDLSVISIREKQGGSGGLSTSCVRGLIAGLVVIGMAIGVWMILSPQAPVELPEAKQPPTAKKETKAAKSYTPPERRQVEKTGDRLKDALAEIEAQGELVKIKAPPQIVIPPGYTNRTFKTGVEQLMSWVFTVQPGDMPMPIPSIGEDERARLSEILASTNEIKEDDSERVAAAKELVDYAKQEMAAFIQEGGDPDDFLQYYFQQLKNAFELRNEAQNTLDELEEEDPDRAAEFAARINENFAEKGIRPIRLTAQEEEESNP